MSRSLERIFVWAGGTVFVASLMLTAWTYLWAFATATPSPNFTAAAIDALLISLFALHHSLFARDAMKRAMSRLVPDRLLRSVYVWIASLLLIMVCLLWRHVGGEAYRVTGWAMWLFVAAQLIGVWTIANSVRAIDPLELAGIHPERPIDALQSNGVYGLVRHPLYLGWLLCVFGSPHMTGDRVAYAIITTAYLIVAMPWEERSLERAFGEGYAKYKRDVRWKIVTYLY